MMDRRPQITVPRAWGGRPLLDLLSERFTYHSREEWERLAREGAVLVNGTPAPPDRALTPGDAVEYLVENIPEPAVATDYRILYHYDAFLVIDKPADLPCHPAGRFFRNTLWAILRRDLEGADLLFTNRLDRETSGIVLIARSPEAARRIGQPSRRQAMVKDYLAVVEGSLREAVHARGWLSADPASALRKKLRFVPEAVGAEPLEDSRFAETWFAPLREYGDLTLVQARLGTGRTHQIRATLLALGYPLVGDKVYGRDEQFYVRFIEKSLTPADHRLLRLNRQALHASRLRFRHPFTEAELDIESPLPPDMTELLKSAGGG